MLSTAHVFRDSRKQRWMGKFSRVLGHHLALKANMRFQAYFTIWYSMCSKVKVTGRIFTKLFAHNDSKNSLWLTPAHVWIVPFKKKKSDMIAEVPANQRCFLISYKHLYKPGPTFLLAVPRIATAAVILMPKITVGQPTWSQLIETWRRNGA